MTISHLYDSPSHAILWGMGYICFETRVFLMADQLRARKDISKPKFAINAWGPNGYRKYERHEKKAIKKGGARLSVNDAQGLAFALGIDLSDLVAKAEREAKLDNQPLQPFNPGGESSEDADEEGG